MIETLGDILRNNAYKFPNETAYVFGDHRISFGDGVYGNVPQQIKKPKARKKKA